MEFNDTLKVESLLKTMGMELLSNEQGEIRMRMPITPVVHQPYGYLHGGATVALCETVASLGTAAMLDLNEEVGMGLEINANHVSSAKDGFATAVGTILHQGRTTHVWDIKVYDDNNKLLCISRCTVAIVKVRKK